MATLDTVGQQILRTAEVLDDALNLGSQVTKSITLTGNNTTVATPLFRVTGSVKVIALYGVVTTALGSNVTACYWRLNDQTAQVNISLNTGFTLSSAAIGSTIVRHSIATVALTGSTNGTGKVFDPVAATAPDTFMPFIAVQKTGAVQTDIEFVYTTTNTPTSGAITFYAMYAPLTASSTLVAV
jgi:hypothetical protein